MNLFLFLIGFSLISFSALRFFQDIKIKKYSSIGIEVLETGFDTVMKTHQYARFEHYYPWVTFEYKVDDSCFFKEREIISDLDFTDKKKVQDFLESLTKNSSAFYDRSNPSHAVLHIPSYKKIVNKHGGIFGAGLAILIISFIVSAS